MLRPFACSNRVSMTGNDRYSAPRRRIYRRYWTIGEGNEKCWKVVWRRYMRSDSINYNYTTFLTHSHQRMWSNKLSLIHGMRRSIAGRRDDNKGPPCPQTPDIGGRRTTGDGRALRTIFTTGIFWDLIEDFDNTDYKIYIQTTSRRPSR